VPEFSRKHRLAVLGISCLSLFMIGLDDTIVSIALPTIAKGFNASVSGLQWIADGYTVVLASLLIFGGATADRFGRRRVFRIGLAAFTTGSALCSLAPSLGWLIVFRVLQAIGGSMLNPVAVSIISNVYTNRAERARAISVWVGMFGLGMALGPAVGGVLVGTVGWRGIFWVNVPVGLCAIALASKFVPESRGPVARQPDSVAQALVIAILGSLIYAIIEGAYTDWRAAAIRHLFMVAAALSAVLVVWELRRKDPLIDLRYFRSRSFTAAVAIAVCAFADMGAFLFLTSIYLQDVHGATVISAGLHMLPTAVAMAICPSVAAWMSATTGSPRLPVLFGGLMLMLSTTLMSRFTGFTANSHLLVTYAVFGLGMGMINGQISVAAVAGMPAGQAGLASGIASASRLVGQTLGVAVAGSLLTEKAHGRMRADFFTLASHSAWHLLFWNSCVVLVAGLMTTRARARHAKTGEVRLGRPPARRVPHDPPSHTQSVTSQEPVLQEPVLQEPVSQPSLESVWIPRSPTRQDSPSHPRSPASYPYGPAE
jgi:EmrB/QacA subfamily drug resistance transporter